MNLFYLAKPKHGGWVSFSAHLALCLGINHVNKIGAKLEDKSRDFGWGVQYQNLPVDYFAQLPKVTILCLEKSHYGLLPIIKQKLDKGHKVSLITHDTVELKHEAIDFLKENPAINLVAIRSSISEYLADKFGIESKFIAHPFFPYAHISRPANNIKRRKSVAISRVDFDKNTHEIIDANYELESYERIEIYGKINNVYEYQVLNKMLQNNHIPFNIAYPEYRGPMKLRFDYLDGVFEAKKFMVDLSTIHDDGGGTQYTFLEAMYNRIPLILHKRWSTGSDKDIFKDNINCQMVSNSEELAKTIRASYATVPDRDMLETNYKIVKNHSSVELADQWTAALN